MRLRRSPVRLPALLLLALTVAHGCTPRPVASGDAPAAAPVDTSRAFWQPAPAPPATNVTAFATAPDGALLAGTTAGLFRRPPAASAWTLLPLRFVQESYTDLGLVPFAQGVTHLAVSDPHVFVAARMGLYRSKSAGQEWIDLKPGVFDLLGGISSTINALHATDDALYVGMQGYGLLRSRDAGTTWAHALSEADFPGENRVSGTSLAEGPDGTLYAGLTVRDTAYTEHPALFRSTDGDVWTEVQPAPPIKPDHLAATPDGVFVHGLDINRETNRARYRLFHLAPGADAWAEVALSDPAPERLATVGGRLYATGPVLYEWQPTDTLAPLDLPASTSTVFAHDGALYAGTNRGVFASNDGGISWAPMNAGFRLTPDGCAASSAGLWAYDTYGGAYRLDGGGTWTAAYRGLPPKPRIRALATAPDGTAWAALGGRGLYRWDADTGWTLADTSATAQQAYASEGGALTISAAGTFLVADQVRPREGEPTPAILHRLSDGGPAPIALPGFPPAGDVRRLVVRRLAASPTGPLYALVGADNTPYAFRSDDDGRTWTPLTVDHAALGLPLPDGEDAAGVPFRDLVVGPDGTLYATLRDQPEPGAPALLRSRDRGATWEAVPADGLFYTTETGTFFRSIGTLAATPGGALVLSTSNRGVFAWTPGAPRWTPLLGGLEVAGARLCLAPDGHLRAFAQNRAYRSAYPVDRWLEAVAP